MKTYKLIVVSLVFILASVLRAEVSAEKKAEIEKMLRLVGMEKIMEQMKTQMLTMLRSEMRDTPAEFWDKFAEKMDTRVLIDKIIPLYDKYYSLEDLRAVNAFYSSAAGQKILATLPQIMQESMLIGQEWGRQLGEQAAKEALAASKSK